MVRIGRVAAASVLAIWMTGSLSAVAQGSGSLTPAEFPPDSYSGSQYVDSRGCVFVRAGVDGAVTWVPRVTRDRQPVCGAKPSLAAGAPSPSPAAPPEETSPTAEAPASVIALRPEARPARSAPARVVRQMAKAPVSMVPEQPKEPRIIPKHVYEAQVGNLPPVPKGYKRVWKDDRLNPHRAHMTETGYRSTQRVWSNTVPRRELTSAQGERRARIVEHVHAPHQ